jgi:hypothetical protein
MEPKMDQKSHSESTFAQSSAESSQLEPRTESFGVLEMGSHKSSASGRESRHGACCVLLYQLLLFGTKETQDALWLMKKQTQYFQIQYYLEYLPQKIMVKHKKNRK